ncbi:MAG: signal peptidase II [Blautia sp.]|nr:signal peptidase II [Blautia sp.]
MRANLSRRKMLRTVLCLVLTIGLAALDQRLKAFAVHSLKGRPGIVLIPGILELGYVENKGMAFGLLQGKSLALAVVSLLFVGFAVWLFIVIPSGKKSIPFLASVILLAAGALGNMVDRLRLGYVIDFISFCLIRFPLFNLADCCVVTGAVSLAVELLFFDREG